MCEVVGCSDVVDDGFCHHDNNGKWFGKPTRKCEQSRNSRMERLVFAGPNVFRDGGRLLAQHFIVQFRDFGDNKQFIVQFLHTKQQNSKLRNLRFTFSSPTLHEDV